MLPPSLTPTPHSGPDRTLTLTPTLTPIPTLTLAPALALLTLTLVLSLFLTPRRTFLKAMLDKTHVVVGALGGKGRPSTYGRHAWCPLRGQRACAGRALKPS